MIPHAAVPFESKLATLFVGAVIGAYLVWGLELTTFRDNRILLGFLIVVVMAIALYGLIIHFRSPLSVLWAERYADYPGRLASTYICPNHFAHLMQMLLPFCIALMFIPQSGMFLRVLCAYSFAAYLPPLFFTESRAGWLGAIAAVGVTVCLMALRRSRKLFAAFAVIVPLFSVLLLFSAWRFSETFQRRATPVVEFLQGQAEGGVGSEAKDFRPQTWMDTIDMIGEAPLIGSGPGNYRYTFPEHRKRCRAPRIVTGHPHNEYLELIADYGLIGFGLFALAWCYGLFRILIASLKAEETRHALIGFAFIGTAAGTMVHSFFDFEMHVFPNALVFVLLAAAAWGPLRGARRRAQGASGKAALECGGSTPLSDEQRRSAISQQPLASQNRSTSEASVQSTSNQQPTTASPASNVQPSTSNVQPSTFNLQRSSFNIHFAGAWLIAVGYLLMTVLCIQTMSSAYIRALADKAAEASQHSPDALRHAQQLYRVAVKVDSSNWRAYKGMTDLIFHERYYSLDMDEKVRLAEDEAGWYEKAHAHNPKDPEICIGYGKCLIFLGRSAVSSKPLAVSPVPSDVGSGKLDVEGQAADVKDAGKERSATGQEQAANSRRLVTPNNRQPTTGNPIETGLDLLREACRYRPFNDVYWWNLGVELRKLGRYDEALDVFRHAVGIKRTRSIVANMEWIELQLRKGPADGAAVGEAAPERVVPKPDDLGDWMTEQPSNPVADPALMDLLERMGRE